MLMMKTMEKKNKQNICQLDICFIFLHILCFSIFVQFIFIFLQFPFSIFFIFKIKNTWKNVYFIFHGNFIFPFVVFFMISIFPFPYSITHPSLVPPVEHVRSFEQPEHVRMFDTASHGFFATPANTATRVHVCLARGPVGSLAVLAHTS